MRIATLVHDRELRRRVDDALAAMGIEVTHFEAVDAAIARLQTQAFAAILVEDCEVRIGHWLGALRTHAAAATTLIAVGSGGAAGMSRALLHGADDYVVIGDGAEQLVHRSLARISVRVQTPKRSALRLGAFTLDLKQGSLSSSASGLQAHLTPRELMLARALFDERDRVVTIERLCADLCGRVDAAAERAVKQHAYQLRRKCEAVAGGAAQRLRIETVYGKGYRLLL